MIFINMRDRSSFVYILISSKLMLSFLIFTRIDDLRQFLFYYFPFSLIQIYVTDVVIYRE